MFDTKEYPINGNNYTLKKFPTILGLHIRKEFFKLHQEGGVPDPEFQVKVVCAGATVNNIQIDQKKFETHFRGKYEELDELFGAILDFNYSTDKAEDEGNGQSATAD